ncbi:MAG: hypothetical protein RLY14_555 [Planctomycetota bacterium]|jgi:hypothetical protein
MGSTDGNFLDDRRKALEDSFFAEKDYRLLQSLKGELELLDASRQLGHVSSIQDEKVLKDLVSVGIRAETWTAARLIPWIEVAWADGDVSSDERAAILKAADGLGVKQGTAAYQILESWLSKRPGPSLIETWKAYMTEVARVLPADSLAKLRDELVDRLNDVANASGGLFGFGKVSKPEMDCIDNITDFLYGDSEDA